MDADGTVLNAVLNMPISVEPIGGIKGFSVLELQLAKETNTEGNQIITETYTDEISQGEITIDIYNANIAGVLRVLVPMRAYGQTAMTARNARILITHKLNKRFDVLGGSIQYLRHSDERVRG